MQKDAVTLWQTYIAGWKLDHLKMYFLDKMDNFPVSHVGLREGRLFVNSAFQLQVVVSRDPERHKKSGLFG